MEHPYVYLLAVIFNMSYYIDFFNEKKNVIAGASCQLLGPGGKLLVQSNFKTYTFNNINYRNITIFFKVFIIFTN